MKLWYRILDFIDEWSPEIVTGIIVGVLLIFMMGVEKAESAEPPNREELTPLFSLNSPHWKKVHHVPSVVILRFFNISDEEIRARAIAGDVSVPAGYLIAGLSYLYEPRKSGYSWTCHIYMAEWANAEDLAHEEKHCNGWNHP